MKFIVILIVLVIVVISFSLTHRLMPVAKRIKRRAKNAARDENGKFLSKCTREDKVEFK